MGYFIFGWLSGVTCTAITYGLVKFVKWQKRSESVTKPPTPTPDPLAALLVRRTRTMFGGKA